MNNEKRQKLKLHYIYYALAAFDLLTILFTLNLGYRIHNIYEKSYEINQGWVERLELLDKLGNTITKLNGPGNDVFSSKDIEKERNAFSQIFSNYTKEYSEVEKKLVKKVSDKNLEKTFSLVQQSVFLLRDEAQLIFSSLEEGRNVKASNHMSQMDVNFSNASLLISEIRSVVRKIQKEQLLIEHMKAEKLFEREIYVAFIIFIIIFVIIYYGHRLKKQFEEQESIIQSQAAKIHQQAKLSSLGEMAGGIAHEINNPLAIIKGNGYKIKRLIDLGKLDTTNLLEIYNVIDKTCNRVQQTINGLRVLSRDGSKDEMAWTSLSTVIENAKSFSETKLISRGVELINFDPHLFEQYEVLCREVQISQVILNLMNNSYDAISKQDEMWIRIDIEENENGSMTLLFTDSGGGIPEDIREKILEPFFTTKEIGKGTGLGLGISHSIMREHGGEIHVNPKSENTQFVLEFPQMRKVGCIREGA